MYANLPLFKQELEQEVHRILRYWMQYAVDEQYGGFYGKIDHDNRPYHVPKGSVLHARILWTFSAACIHYKEPAYIKMAHRAYQYILDRFIDHKYGGVYWSTNNDRKQIYAHAFAIYGLSEYYRATQWEPARQLAIHLYELVQRFSFDTHNGGYLEAFTADWQPIADMRLSDKDVNEKKTMNTHLHVLEAYTSLYGIWPDARLEESIVLLLGVFNKHFIRKGHLQLFFDEHWQPRSDDISHGHDIEASWLLTEAANALADPVLIQQTEKQALLLADAVAPDIDGGIWSENEKHWWPQAEAMLGFFNAWQISNRDGYLQQALNSWAFIKKYMIDHVNGEWFWGVDAHHQALIKEDKAGFWKCPYHNTRACLEVIKRLDLPED